MRILYLTSGFPYPLTSGFLRNYFLMKELSPFHEITLLSLVGPNFKEEYIEALRPLTEEVHVFASTMKGRSLPTKALARLRALVEGAPADMAIRQMQQTVRSLMAEKAFDLAVFNLTKVYPAIEGVRRLPVVADLCDANSIRVRGQMDYADGWRWFELLWDYYQLRRIEKRAARNASHVVLASYRDRQAIEAATRSPISVVPNGVDLEFWRRSSPQLGRNTIVFTGSMNYPPNVDAALHLIEDIFPLVQHAVPDARLLLVGRNPPSRLLDAGRRPGVTVTGYVKDVRPYLEQATVFAAPLRFSSGIQNKLLEAMAMALPVIASPEAADGLRTETGEHPPVQVARSGEEFARLITTELTRRETVLSPDKAARRFVEEHFVWKRSGEKMAEIIRKVAGSAGAVLEGGMGEKSVTYDNAAL